MQDLHGNRKPGPLNLDIYSAVLGGRPRIGPRVAGEDAAPPPPRQTSRPRIAVPVESGVDGPIDAEFRDRLGRCVAQAARLLAEVRSRVVGVFQESTIGKRDKRPSSRGSVRLGDAVRRDADVTRAT